MSAAFWSTPELSLCIGNSRLRVFFWWAGLVLSTLALLLVAFRGHVSLAVILMLPAALGLARGYRDALSGMQLRCHQNRWRVGRNDQMQAATLVGHSITLPWLVFIALRPTGGRAVLRLWLFRDALSAQEYRRLRVCLTLA